MGTDLEKSSGFRVQRGENGGRTFLSAISIHITNGKHADGERQEKLTTESTEEEREINHKRHKKPKGRSAQGRELGIDHGLHG